MQFIETLLLEAHEEWRGVLRLALDSLNKEYLEGLATAHHYLPKKESLLAAFSIPRSTVRYILLGESPYPRAHSANGYAFWDNAVHELWSMKGFSKEVNRATSLRNFFKMLLYARGDLTLDFSQPAIAALDKTPYHQTARSFFQGFMQHGFLLLNASLVYSANQVPFHARHWQAFMNTLLNQLAKDGQNIELVLLGRIAEKIPASSLPIGLAAEHPYNISFITNPKVVSFFNPMDLLKNDE